jgi:hypothetical protein
LIQKLHSKLKFAKLSDNEKSNFSDDLPAFLINLSAHELETLINDINNNLVKEDNAHCKMYTIHSYKGMESNIIRIANDIDKKEEQNLYYVALTRGKHKIICDTKIIKDESMFKQSKICEFIKINTECYQPNENITELDKDYIFGELDKINNNILFESNTKCGQHIKISNVKKSGGINDDKLRIYITGPLIQCKIRQKSKTLYSVNDLKIAKESAIQFLNKLNTGEYKTRTRTKSTDKKLKSSDEKTINYYKSGKNISEISKLRELTEETICGHLINNYDKIKLKTDDFMTNDIKQLIENKINRLDKCCKLSEIKETLPYFISYTQIKIVKNLLE